MSKYTTLQSFSEMNSQIVPMPEVPTEEPKSSVDNATLEEKLNWITDKVPLKEGNIMGSQAGAGSGDFHQYRMARRREMFRWERVEKEEVERVEREAFESRKAQREASDLARTSKNRAKRDKRKQAKDAKRQKVDEDAFAPAGPPDDYEKQVPKAAAEVDLD
ncbi:hypothetical protein CYMTET_9056 [Cymbomonas tetramitiformis]|uniref:Uncharacterized protein n=1 Tax=Cymbomonas tetramitiformis TaxID=36881 RepID=A0AAE0LFV7_9CHLO|nr:hypothetical protein CYMTET_9056 [Cymbomonas tetramitiformis]